MFSPPGGRKYMRYTEGFKRSLIRKVFDGNGRPADEVAQEARVHPATLGRWIQKYRAGTLEEDGGEGIQPSHRNPGEKLCLLLESKTVGPEAQGEWLRCHGLHTEHLRLWEQELSTMANGTEQSKRDENSQLRKENKNLKKELARKEKALAEAAVLLTLKKNYQTLFKDDGEA
jgi:transposase-like protein